MSDTSINYVKIPRFKDKVMYIPASISKTKMEMSYPVSASFKGIVRLSPNNHNTTYERAEIQLDINDETMSTTYTDAIKFEDDLKDVIKSSADITKRMIIGSDSDGYLVPFRISEYNLEFDNLGVIGSVETDKLTIFTSNPESGADTFLINGQRMPSRPSSNVSDGILYKDSTNNNSKEPVYPDEYDTRKVKITGTPDNSEILYCTVDGNNKRVFNFKQTSQFIKDVIMEALLDLQSIPTGSIQFVPVSIKQYKELVENNGYSPNKVKNAGKEVDPLVRDFLLCDGRRYRNKDFPELAKILWKEPIHRWSKVEIEGNVEGNYYKPVFDGTCNDYEKQEPKSDDEVVIKTFRVPDLRHTFISSIYLNGTTEIASGGAETPIANINSPSESADVVGSWCNDNNMTCSKDVKYDTHRHFICYGDYGPLPKPNDSTSSETSSEISLFHISPDYIETQKFLSNGDTTHILTPTNHTTKITKDNSSFLGFHFRTSSTRDKGHKGVDAIPASMFLSIPGGGSTKNDNFSKYNESKISLGKSSYDIPSFHKPSNYSDINSNFQSNPNTDDITNDTHVSWDAYMG